MPVTMEEALQIVLNLEALDRSRDTDLKVSTDRAEQSGRADKKENYARVLVQPSTTTADSLTCLLASGTVFTMMHSASWRIGWLSIWTRCDEMWRDVTACSTSSGSTHHAILSTGVLSIVLGAIDRICCRAICCDVTAGRTILSSAITRRPNCCTTASTVCWPVGRSRYVRGRCSARGSTPHRRWPQHPHGLCHGCGQVGPFIQNCLNLSQDRCCYCICWRPIRQG